MAEGLKVSINIGTLQLNGFSERDAMRLEYGFRSELTWLTQSSGDFVGLERESFEDTVANPNAESMGRSVAHSVYGGLTNG